MVNSPTATPGAHQGIPLRAGDEGRFEDCPRRGRSGSRRQGLCPRSGRWPAGPHGGGLGHPLASAAIAVVGGWLVARVVRFAVLMVVVYAGVILFGLNEFRETPVGFIPQVDQGYLIIVTQLPGGASLAGTDEVNRRVAEIAFQVPGITHAVNLVGFSGGTFTNAPNST
jgi:hypothetical protein